MDARFRGQTKTPDLSKARGARIARCEDQPPQRRTSGHVEVEAAKRTHW